MDRLKNLIGIAFLGAVALAVPSANAATLTADLNCSLNLAPASCPGGTSFGTVTLDDTAADGTLLLTIDLLNPDIKFKDFILAYDGTPADIYSDPVGFGSGSYAIPPYTTFNLGIVSGDSGDSWILKSDTLALTLADFENSYDAAGFLQVAVHIQSIGSASGGDCDGSGDKDPCVPGMTGAGSLKIGGTWERDGGGDTSDVPEPSTMLLMGGGLLGLAYWRKRRNS